MAILMKYVIFMQRNRVFEIKQFIFKWYIKFRIKLFSKGAYRKQIKKEIYILANVQAEINRMKFKPTISILLPIYNTDEDILTRCIESVLVQYYVNWELCISDDNSSRTYIKKVIEKYSEKDSRIKFFYRNHNGHISENSNSALSLATGEYTILLDHDDELPQFALFEIVKSINSNPETELFFSDEDQLINGERAFPFRKKKWNAQKLLYVNYMCHVCVYKTSFLRTIGGFRTGYEGAQDWDLVLRAVEKTDKIVHIPKVLYHWRVSSNSTALSEKVKPYVKEAQKKVVSEAILRRGCNRG